MTHPNPQRHVVPTPVLTKSKLVPITAARPVTVVVPNTHVTRPRPAKNVVTKPHAPPRRHINRSQSPKPNTFSLKVTAAKAHMVNVVKGNWVRKVNVVKGTKGNWVWKPKCTVLDYVSRLLSASMTLKQFDYTDALGRFNDSAGSDLATLARTDLVTQEGTDLVTQEGTNLVTQAGTNLVTQAGTDLVTQAGTNLVTQAGTDLVTSTGTDLVNPAGTDLDYFSDNRSRLFF
uniref:Uncharacterized protein n=1 Tax=Tanacetum cinerariifolium TaxID=118510 RepID=A0A699KNZ6_TANCI|nr:hypothetical protein [Tanacetum cinerariifolium]